MNPTGKSGSCSSVKVPIMSFSSGYSQAVAIDSKTKLPKIWICSPARVSERFAWRTGISLVSFRPSFFLYAKFSQFEYIDEEYDSWNTEYRNAQVQITDRDEHIEQASSKIEKRLTLLGATAIEDKLQDGVPATIADLKRAGIKVWVATGDKLETAVGRCADLV